MLPSFQLPSRSSDQHRWREAGTALWQSIFEDDDSPEGSSLSAADPRSRPTSNIRMDLDEEDSPEGVSSSAVDPGSRSTSNIRMDLDEEDSPEGSSLSAADPRLSPIQNILRAFQLPRAIDQERLKRMDRDLSTAVASLTSEVAGVVNEFLRNSSPSPADMRGLLSYCALWIGDTIGGEILQLERLERPDSERLFLQLLRKLLDKQHELQTNGHSGFGLSHGAILTLMIALSNWDSSIDKFAQLEEQLKAISQPLALSIMDHQPCLRTSLDNREHEIIGLVGTSSRTYEMTKNLKERKRLIEARRVCINRWLGSGTFFSVSIRTEGVPHRIEARLQQQGDEWQLTLWQAGYGSPADAHNSSRRIGEATFCFQKNDVYYAIELLLAAQNQFIPKLYSCLSSLTQPRAGASSTSQNRPLRVYFGESVQSQYSGSCGAKGRRVWLKLCALRSLFATEPGQIELLFALMDLVASQLLQKFEVPGFPSLNGARRWMVEVAGVRRFMKALRRKAPLPVLAARGAAQLPSNVSSSEQARNWTESEFPSAPALQEGVNFQRTRSADYSANHPVLTLFTNPRADVPQWIHDYLDRSGMLVEGPVTVMGWQAWGLLLSLEKKRECVLKEFEGRPEIVEQVRNALDFYCDIIRKRIGQLPRQGFASDWRRFYQKSAQYPPLTRAPDYSLRYILMGQIDHYERSARSLYKGNNQDLDDLFKEIKTTSLDSVTPDDLEKDIALLKRANNVFRPLLQKRKHAGDFKKWWAAWQSLVTAFEFILKWPDIHPFHVRAQAVTLESSRGDTAALFDSERREINSARAMDMMGISALLERGAFLDDPLEIANDLVAYGVPLDSRNAELSPDESWLDSAGISSLTKWIQSVSRKSQRDLALTSKERSAIWGLSERFLTLNPEHPGVLDLWKLWHRFLRDLSLHGNQIIALLFRLECALYPFRRDPDVEVFGSWWRSLGVDEMARQIVQDPQHRRALENLYPQQRIISLRLTDGVLLESRSEGKLHIVKTPDRPDGSDGPNSSLLVGPSASLLADLFEERFIPQGWIQNGSEGSFRPRGGSEAKLVPTLVGIKLMWLSPITGKIEEGLILPTNPYAGFSGVPFIKKEAARVYPQSAYAAFDPFPLAQNVVVIGEGSGDQKSFAQFLAPRIFESVPGIFRYATRLLNFPNNRYGVGLTKRNDIQEVARFECIEGEQPVVLLPGQDPITIENEVSCGALRILCDRNGRGIMKDYFWNDKPLAVHWSRASGKVIFGNGWELSGASTSGLSEDSQDLVERLREAPGLVIEAMKRGNQRGIFIAEQDSALDYDSRQEAYLRLRPQALFLIENDLGLKRLDPEQDPKAVVALLPIVSKWAPTLAKDLFEILASQQPALPPLEWHYLLKWAKSNLNSGIFLSGVCRSLHEKVPRDRLDQLMQGPSAIATFRWPKSILPTLFQTPDDRDLLSVITRVAHREAPEYNPPPFASVFFEAEEVDSRLRCANDLMLQHRQSIALTLNSLDLVQQAALAYTFGAGAAFGRAFLWSAAKQSHQNPGHGHLLSTMPLSSELGDLRGDWVGLVRAYARTALQKTILERMAALKQKRTLAKSQAETSTLPDPMRAQSAIEYQSWMGSAMSVDPAGTVGAAASATAAAPMSEERGLSQNKRVRDSELEGLIEKRQRNGLSGHRGSRGDVVRSEETALTLEIERNMRLFNSVAPRSLDPMYNMEVALNLYRRTDQEDIFHAMRTKVMCTRGTHVLIEASTGAGKTSFLNPLMALELARYGAIINSSAVVVVPDALATAAMKTAREIGEQIFGEPLPFLDPADARSKEAAMNLFAAAKAKKYPVTLSASSWHFLWLRALSDLLHREDQNPTSATILGARPEAETNLRWCLHLQDSYVLIDEADELLATSQTYNLPLEEPQPLSPSLARAFTHLSEIWLQSDLRPSATLSPAQRRTLLENSAPSDWDQPTRDGVIQALIHGQPPEQVTALNENHAFTFLAWMTGPVAKLASTMKLYVDYGPSNSGSVNVVPYSKAHWPSDQRFSNFGLEALLLMEMCLEATFWNLDRAQVTWNALREQASDEGVTIAEWLDCQPVPNLELGYPKFLEELASNRALRLKVGLWKVKNSVRMPGSSLRSYASGSMMRSLREVVATTGTAPPAYALPTGVERVAAPASGSVALSNVLEGVLISPQPTIQKALEQLGPFHILLDPNGLLSQEEAKQALTTMAQRLDPQGAKKLLKLTWCGGTPDSSPDLCQVGDGDFAGPPPSDQDIAQRHKVVVYQQAQCRGAHLDPGPEQEDGLLFLERALPWRDLVQAIGRLRGFNRSGGREKTQSLHIALAPKLYASAENEGHGDLAEGLRSLCERHESRFEASLTLELLRQELSAIQQTLFVLNLAYSIPMELPLDQFRQPSLQELLAQSDGVEAYQAAKIQLNAQLMTVQTGLDDLLRRAPNNDWRFPVVQRRLLALHARVQSLPALPKADSDAFDQVLSRQTEQVAQMDQRQQTGLELNQQRRLQMESQLIAGIDQIGGTAPPLGLNDALQCALKWGADRQITGLQSGEVTLLECGVHEIEAVVQSLQSQGAEPANNLILEYQENTPLYFSPIAFQPFGRPLPLGASTRLAPLVLMKRLASGEFFSILLAPKELTTLREREREWREWSGENGARVFSLEGAQIGGAFGTVEGALPADWDEAVTETLQRLRRVRALFGVPIPNHSARIREDETEWLRTNPFWLRLWIAASHKDDRENRIQLLLK